MKKVYQCEFCKDSGWEDEELGTEHEKKCDFNPARRTCCTCKLAKYVSDEYWPDDGMVNECRYAPHQASYGFRENCEHWVLLPPKKGTV